MESREIAGLLVKSPKPTLPLPGNLCGWAAAGSVDTDLSFLSFLKVYRTDAAQRRMLARWVVEPLDVVKDIGSGLLPGAVHLSGCALRLQ